MKSFIFTILTSFIFITCSEGTSPINNSDILFRQVPGCGNIILPKPAGDSSFSYSFDNSLKINLNLPANCCPDTNRFDYIYTIDEEEINFIAVDTAAHLCKCICNYTIEIVINDLDRDNYQFICTYYDSLYYNERIFR
jgi:hypothetical protein